MAKRKGKSRRRVKDWQRRYRQADGDAIDEAHASETLQKPRVKIPAFRDRAPGEAELAHLPRGEGMVTGLFPGGAEVRVGADDLLCRIAGTFRAPAGATALAVGDLVTLALARAEHVSGDKASDGDRADGVILARQPRASALSRPAPGSGKRRGRYDDEPPEKVIAANMDLLLIVAAVRQPALRPGLIDRFCIVAERGEMEPVVAFNKIDLAPAPEEALGELSAGEVRTVRCSAVTGEGLDDLRAVLPGRRSVIAGASGVGKSTLVNALVPGAGLATRSIRAKDQRGRHVTAAATVHDLPGGGLIVDTPGIRELATGITVGELPWYFPEMASLGGQCRFNDCTHTHEPDCAVIAAVEAGRILPRRYRSYLRILETI